MYVYLYYLMHMLFTVNVLGCHNEKNPFLILLFPEF